MSNKKGKCPDCGAEMKRATREIVWNYRGKKYTYKQSGMYCTRCDNAHLSDEDVETTEKQLIAFRAEVDAALNPLLPPPEIKAAREKLGISQKRASELFGGGPMAFSKYERGQYKQSVSTDILLRLLIAGTIKISDIEKLKRNIVIIGNTKTKHKGYQFTPSIPR
jgi:HTH-type transcriptional regulator/antitoxin MqsA